MPFRDYPDGRRSGDRTFPHAYTEDEEDDRDDREIMDSQEMVMQGEWQHFHPTLLRVRTVDAAGVRGRRQ